MNWGSNANDAFDATTFRLMLSGPPFRSDAHRIPFVTFEDGVSLPAYSYGHDRARSDRICRVLVIPHFDGTMEWFSNSEVKRATFDDEIPEEEASRRLRTALDLRGEWLARVLREA